MTRARKATLWIVLALIIVSAAVGLYFRRQHLRPLTLRGAVTVHDADPRKQLPIAGVEISLKDLAAAPTVSDSSGFFRLTLPQGLRRGRPITFLLRHPGYQPLDLPEYTGDKLYVIRLIPLQKNTDSVPKQPTTTVSNVRVRYSTKAMRTINVGSAVQTFRGRQQRQRPLQGPVPVFARWTMESHNRIHHVGRRPRQRVSKRPGLLHCGSVPLHENRIR